MYFMNKNNRIININNYNNKSYFVGISISGSPSTESGIAVIDRDLNIVRIDKIFNLNDLQLVINNLGPANNIIVCVDLPKNVSMNTNKWRYEAKNISSFKTNNLTDTKFSWADRFSDRGSDFCSNIQELGIETYRYYCYFTKNILKLNPPFRSRSPVACKYLQMIIQNNLKISGIPTNLIALSGLDALIGAYTGWKISTSNENFGYKCIGEFNTLPIVTAI